jgi:hypothetical protein
MLRAASSLAFASLAAAHAHAQVKLVGSGDVVAGFGAVSGVQVAAVDDAGRWVARAALSGGPAFVVLRDGAPWLVEGGALSGTVGGTLSELAWSAWNGAGELAWAGEASLPIVMGPAPVLGFEAGVVRAFGDPVGASAGFGPGSFYAGFAFPALNDARAVLVRAVIEDPGVPGFGAAALVRIDLDAAGGIVGEARVAAVGDALAGGTVSELATHGRLAWSNGGDALFWALVAPAKEVLVRSGALVAESGGTAPTGDPWIGFGDGLAQNEPGDVAFVGVAQGVSGPETVVVRNGAVVVRSGGALPALAPATFLDFTGERLCIAADGRVAFVGTWSDGAPHAGVFVDDRPVVRFGLTQIGPRVVTGLAPGPGGGLRARPDGALSAALAFADGSAADYVLSVDGALVRVPGCFGNPGSLTATGKPAVGEQLAFTVHAGQAPGVTPFLGFATAPATGGACGLAVPGLGELLIAAPVLVLGGGTPWIGAPLAFTVPVPQPLYGAHLFVQALFVDLAGVVPAEPFRLTGAVKLEIGL